MTVIPTDAAKFKVWADAACGEWPSQLQQEAYAAWQHMLIGKLTAFDRFSDNFKKWEASK